jgi:hypothetical protein
MKAGSFCRIGSKRSLLTRTLTKFAAHTMRPCTCRIDVECCNGGQTLLKDQLTSLKLLLNIEFKRAGYSAKRDPGGRSVRKYRIDAPQGSSSQGSPSLFIGMDFQEAAIRAGETPISRPLSLLSLGQPSANSRLNDQPDGMDQKPLFIRYFLRFVCRFAHAVRVFGSIRSHPFIGQTTTSLFEDSFRTAAVAISSAVRILPVRHNAAARCGARQTAGLRLP